MHSLPGPKHAWDMEVRNRRVRVECLESLHVVRECLGDRFFLSCHSHHLLLVKPNNRLSGLLSCNWLRVLQLALTFCSLCSNALPQGTLPTGGPCTCPLRINTVGSPVDCHRGKKA